ncbi:MULTISPECIES: hypothetical protein [unclassified Rickettsia]|uniref:hypothetical protein n=1 Tax=unclassified Rickettsia TaxID=114295 RepID=UPI003132EFD9
MKRKSITDTELKVIREIFANHRNNIDNVLVGIKEAKTYLEENVEKSGLYEFAVKTMESTFSLPEENIVARQLFSDLNCQLIGEHD